MTHCRLTLCVFVLFTSWTHAKDIIPTPADTPVLGELEPVLIKLMMKSGGGRENSLAKVYTDKKLTALVKKHDLRLFGGPMLGCVTDSSARIWVRTPAPAEVQVVLSANADLSDPIKSKAVRTGSEADLTAIMKVSGLKPNTLYHYDVTVDGRPVLKDKPARFRTSPALGQKAKFDVAFGGGARYVPEHEHIWDTVASFHPSAFLFLGDNIYIDDPKNRSRHRLYYYRRQLRPEFQRLTAGAACYSIWDDHDFGANDCAGGLDPFKPDWKVPVWRVFQENWVNPGYGGGEKQPGCWYKFSIGDVEFFMTDGRYYRSFEDGTMLGPAQKKWLLGELGKSTATFKVLASGTLWTETADKGGADSWWGVKGEREEILSLIDRKKIGGVVLLSADRHRTDIYRIKRPNGYDLYEFETSKLTNRHTHATRKQAIFSYNKGNFFGMLTFDLTAADPTISFRCITIDGKTVHTMMLKRSQLEAK
jgi:alkaline phosphatase D